MTTVINNPGDGGGNSGGMGMVIGAVLAIIIVIAFFVYGLPALRDSNNEGTNINVPDQVDVNVNDNTR